MYETENARNRIDPNVDTNSVHAAQKAILNYARELRGLNSATEQDFLSLGLSLGEVSTEARNVSTLAASVVDLVRNEELERDASRFRDLFDSLDEHFRQSRLKAERGHDPLRHMGDIVNDAYRPLSAFRKIVKHLRMLSVSTRIENARLADNDNSFDVLAENVENLSVMIALKSDGFLEGLTSLQETIKETAEKIITSRAYMEERTELMLRSLSTNLSMLSEKASSSLRAVSTLTARSDEVSRGISEVVSSLQFHDITRQQIEHVADIFDEIGTSDNGASISMDALRHVGGLQIDQLTHAKDELVSAIERVITNLHQIVSLLADMSREAATLTAVTGSDGASFLSELNDSVSLVMGSFVANEETGRGLSAAVTSVTGMVEKLMAFVDDIEEIGSEIELIALNAQIKASHKEEDGGALGVLAEAIRNLSDDAGPQTLIMTDALKGVRDYALDLDALWSDSGSIRPIKEQMQDLLEALGRSHQTLVRCLDGLDKKSSGLTRAIETAVRGITAHDRANKVMGGIIQAVERLLPCDSRAADHAERTTGNDYMDLVANRYTMDQERHVHQSYLSGTQGVSGEARDGDFGNNVELF
jgi:methyl-accepting chemotaxis protein